MGCIMFNLSDSALFGIILVCIGICIGCVVLTGLMLIMNGGVVCV